MLLLAMSARFLSVGTKNQEFTFVKSVSRRVTFWPLANVSESGEYEQNRLANVSESGESKQTRLENVGESGEYLPSLLMNVSTRKIGHFMHK
jgi:hypothetical protein